MKEIYHHPVLGSFTQDECEEIWHAFREKNPNWTWSLTVFGLWALWCMTWMILAQYIQINFMDGLLTSLGLHLLLTLIIGVIGGVMVVGKIMLPRRMKEFHSFLSGKDKVTLLGYLELHHLSTEQVVPPNGP